MELLVACAHLLQDRAAEDAFRKIEESLEKAGTIRVRLRGEGEAKGGAEKVAYKVSGRMLLKEGNRARIEMKTVLGALEREAVIVSDGAKMWVRTVQGPPRTQDTPGSLKASLAGALTRLGLLSSVDSCLGGQDPKKAFEASEFRAGPEEAGLKSVVFKVSVPGGQGQIESTLWYDPATFRLAKSAVTARTGTVEHSAAETYEEYVLGGEIPDEEFKRPEEKPAEKAPVQAEDVADVPSQDLRAGGDKDKRYFLIGPKKDAKEPGGGYNLLVVLPGGDGSADFHPFVKRIFKYALGERALAAELVAVDWTGGDPNRVVWPTGKLCAPKMKFATEEFVEAVVADVAGRHRIDRRKVFTLSWSSGGPAAYAASLAPKSSVTGSFIAMSVFRPEWLPALGAAKGHSCYLFQSPEDPVCPLAHAERAAEALRLEGAKVELVTYPGGHGWRGPVFPNIRKGLDWLEKNAAGAAEK